MLIQKREREEEILLENHQSKELWRISFWFVCRIFKRFFFQFLFAFVLIYGLQQKNSAYFGDLIVSTNLFVLYIFNFLFSKCTNDFFFFSQFHIIFPLNNIMHLWYHFYPYWMVLSFYIYQSIYLLLPIFLSLLKPLFWKLEVLSA